MYRLLAANRMLKDRRRLARHQTRARPELIATGSGQVFTWDITKLPGPDKGLYYDAYVMIDIYSRYIVSAAVHARESGILAKEMMEEVFTLHGVPQVVHADRGTSMTSKTVAALLVDLNVTRSHSRPRVSNDNPFSEAWFKTLKYAPVFPERFGSLQHARVFMDSFVQFYNHEHHHSGIGLHTPADVHYGLSAATDQTRQQAHRQRGASGGAYPFQVLRAPGLADQHGCARAQPDDERDQEDHDRKEHRYGSQRIDAEQLPDIVLLSVPDSDCRILAAISGTRNTRNR
jgi:hypothetical protein